MEKASIAKAFNALMKRDKVTLSEIAEETGLNLATLSKLKSKDTNTIDLEILEKLSIFFGEDVSIFFGIDTYKRPEKLSDEEEKVVSAMRRMNAAGQNKLMDQADILLQVKAFENTDAPRRGR